MRNFIGKETAIAHTRAYKPARHRYHPSQAHYAIPWLLAASQSFLELRKNSRLFQQSSQPYANVSECSTKKEEQVRVVLIIINTWKELPI